MKYGVLDIGGSNIKAAVVDSEDKVLFSMDAPTPSSETEFSRSLESIIDRIKKEAADIGALVIGVPGLVDYTHDSVIECPNIKVEIKKPKEDIPVFFANDADLALYGEIALRGLEDKSVGLLTLGTGVGGAFSVAGLDPDSFPNSGEIGHMKIVANGRECSCSSRGCLEAYTSGSAILSQAKQKISPEIQSVREVFDLAGKDDEKASLIVSEMAQMLGVGIASLINILGLEYIFLAGQVAKSSYIFMPDVIKSVEANVFLGKFRNVKIEQSYDIDRIALVGGARFAKRKLKE